MAVTEALSALSTTAASNTPAGTDSIGTDLDDHLRDIKKNIRFASNNPVQTAKITAYTVLATDHNTLLQVNATASAVTVTLLAAATAGDGFRVGVKRLNATNAVTVDGNSSETIDGSVTSALTTINQVQWYACDGSNWQVEADCKSSNVAKGADIASSNTMVIGTDGNYFDITGTTTINTMTVAINRHFFLQFDGALQLTHDATDLDLPSEANITTAAGDVAEFFATGANDVQCVNYTKADGTAVVASAGMEKGGDIASASPLVVDTDGDYFDVTGTTGFAAMTVATNRHFFLQFDGALTMTHHATNLDLPGEANITTAVGDIGEFFSTGTNTVQCVNYTKADGTAVAGGITEGTNTATTSGTAIDFTSLPSGVKRILVIFEQVSTNGTSSLLIQIGDSGGFETTGYESVGDTDTTRTRELTGFQLTGDGGTAANAEMTGIITLARADSATFLWVASGSLHRTDAIATNHQRSNGFKSLSSELTQLRLTTVGGSNVFDNGTANIQYEF